VVDPSDVRLIPDDEDPYAWTWASDREHLFKKQLSKHSVGAYVQLCREVGISFEAVAKSDERQTPFPATTKVCSVPKKFLAKTHRFQTHERTRARIEQSQLRV